MPLFPYNLQFSFFPNAQFLIISSTGTHALRALILMGAPGVLRDHFRCLRDRMVAWSS